MTADPDALAVARECIRLAEMATPGPWGFQARRSPRSIRLKRTHYEVGKDGGDGVAFAFGDDNANAAFIAYCRTAAPILARALLAREAK
jgi:hypothetical protein